MHEHTLNWINGNRSDVLAAMDDMSPARAARLAVTIYTELVDSDRGDGFRDAYGFRCALDRHIEAREV